MACIDWPSIFCNAGRCNLVWNAPVPSDEEKRGPNLAIGAARLKMKDCFVVSARLLLWRFREVSSGKNPISRSLVFELEFVIGQSKTPFPDFLSLHVAVVEGTSRTISNPWNVFSGGGLGLLLVVASANLFFCGVLNFSSRTIPISEELFFCNALEVTTRTIAFFDFVSELKPA